MNEVAAGKAQPLSKVLPGAVDPLRLFSALSDRGAHPHAFLLESADVHSGNAERSLGCAEPCLRLSGLGLEFEMLALNRTGEKMLEVVAPTLDFAFELDVGKTLLTGTLPEPREGLEERERLREPGPMDLLRALKNAFVPESATSFPPGGLFGTFAYDFIDQFETLSQNQNDPHPTPDYLFYFADHLFLVDHIHDRTVLVATALGLPDSEEEYARAQELLRAMEEAAQNAPALDDLPAPPRSSSASTDLSDAEYEDVVEKLKEHILAGDVFQIVPSRSFDASAKEEALTTYRRLRALNPSPYMFFLRMENDTLLGASPETALKVSGGRAEIRPIAGTKPRGLRDGIIDEDLDARYEAELKLDAKELAEHVMLVDLARNDVARVSRAGTRRVDRLFTVEKYSHVQHLVSSVSGELREDLDPLHAYLATMNMGTLTGAPKVEAMRLLRETERTRRGFYGGSVGYWMLDGDFDTCIVIRSLHLTGGRAIARAGAGVVFDSVPEREADETRRKAAAPLAALGLTKEGA